MKKSEREFHRKNAISCFNQSWDYIEKRKTPENTRTLLNLAHASRYHWDLIGNSINQAIGDWQLSRIYSTLGEPKVALLFAKSCLRICTKEKLTNIAHTANEAMARAYATGGNLILATKFLNKARRQLKKLAPDDEDMRIYLGQIDETQKVIDALHNT